MCSGKHICSIIKRLWVSNYCWTSNIELSPYIMARTSYILMRLLWRKSQWDEYDENLSEMLRFITLEHWQTCRSTHIHYLRSEPTRLTPEIYVIMGENSKFQFVYSLIWPDSNTKSTVSEATTHTTAVVLQLL